MIVLHTRTLLGCVVHWVLSKLELSLESLSSSPPPAAEAEQAQRAEAAQNNKQLGIYHNNCNDSWPQSWTTRVCNNKLLVSNESCYIVVIWTLSTSHSIPRLSVLL